MSRIKKLPPLDFIKECLDYNSETGKLTWKERPLSHFRNEGVYKRWNKRFCGGLALDHTNTNGYKDGTITYKGKQIVCTAHRVAWYLTYGEEPENIDHINGKTDDNRISNLRKCTHSQNMRNCRSNSELPKGVSWDKRRGKYRATIYRDSQNRYIGNFETIEEAKNAYDSEAIKLHGNFYRK